MKASRLLAMACLAAVFLATAAAQETPRLLFEVSVDGTVVAKPELRVRPGEESRLDLDDLQVRFTPTLRGDDIVLEFRIQTGGDEIFPTLRISRTTPGSLRFRRSVDGPDYRIAISRLQ